MTLEIDILPNLLDLAIRADKDRATEDAHKLLAIALPFTPKAQLL